jgi:hypothetical protein
VGVGQLFREILKENLSENRKMRVACYFREQTSRLAMDDSDNRESDAAERTPLKIKAEDNPWYLLATLYGVPEFRDDELKNKNRDAWNRYFAGNLDEETRARLIYEKRHPAEELTPFSSDELQEVERAFVKRKGSAREMSFPAGSSEIDFSNVQFDTDITFDKYLFPKSFFLTRPSPVGPCSTKRRSLATLISAGRASQAWPTFGTQPSPRMLVSRMPLSLSEPISQAPPFPAWLLLITPGSPALAIS